MIYLFDTNIIIGLLKKDEIIVLKMGDIKELNISVITIGEMLYGANNSNNAAANSALYKEFFKCCNVMNITEKTAGHYADIRYALKTKGNPIPENDIWIAAIAKENNMTIVTRDKHLNMVEFIKTEEW